MNGKFKDFVNADEPAQPTTEEVKTQEVGTENNNSEAESNEGLDDKSKNLVAQREVIKGLKEQNATLQEEMKNLSAKVEELNKPKEEEVEDLTKLSDNEYLIKKGIDEDDLEEMTEAEIKSKREAFALKDENELLKKQLESKPEPKVEEEVEIEVKKAPETKQVGGNVAGESNGGNTAIDDIVNADDNGNNGVNWL